MTFRWPTPRGFYGWTRGGRLNLSINIKSDRWKRRPERTTPCQTPFARRYYYYYCLRREKHINSDLTRRSCIRGSMRLARCLNILSIIIIVCINRDRARQWTLIKLLLLFSFGSLLSRRVLRLFFRFFFLLHLINVATTGIPIHNNA